MKNVLSSQYDEYLEFSQCQEISQNGMKYAKRLWVEIIGDLAVDKVSRRHVLRFQKRLAANRAHATVNKYMTHIRTFFAWLVGMNELSKNPFFGVKDLPTSDPIIETYTPLEIEALVTNSMGCMQLLILFAVVAGLRRTEGLNLVVQDIELGDDQHYVHVRPKPYTEHTWAWGAKHRYGKYDTRIGIPKTVAFPNIIVDFEKLLIAQIAQLKDGQPYVCLPKQHYTKRIATVRQTGQLYWADRNCPWRGFSNVFLRLTRRLRIKGKSFHNLRSTCATALYNNGLGIAGLQGVMRHKSIATTMRSYISVGPDLPQRTAAMTKMCYSTEQ